MMHKATPFERRAQSEAQPPAGADVSKPGFVYGGKPLQRKSMFAVPEAAEPPVEVPTSAELASSAAQELPANARRAASVRSSFVSATQANTTDLRKLCNGVKRMTALSAASLATHGAAGDVVAIAERITDGLLRRFGIDPDNDQRAASALPMVMEAVSTVMAHAMRDTRDAKEFLADADARVANGVEFIFDLTKMRSVSKMLEQQWPEEIDNVTALRLSFAGAMSQMAVELEDCDFAGNRAAMLKGASQHLMKTVLDAVGQLVIPATSPASRLMLTQSLLHSGARLYAAAWRKQALMQQGHELQAADAVAAINKRFTAAFESIVESSREMFLPPAEEKHQLPRPR